MENHKLESFINNRVQYGELKYQIATESILFESDHQEIIDQVNKIQSKHFQVSVQLKQQNLSNNHIHQLICSQILGNQMAEKPQYSPINYQQFYTFYPKKSDIFGEKKIKLALAAHQFKNMAVRNFQMNCENDALDYLLYASEIAIELDYSETKQLFQYQNQAERLTFIQQYILTNLKFNKDFIHRLNLWSEKYKMRNSNNLILDQNQFAVFVYTNNWIEQLHQITDKLSKPHLINGQTNELQPANYQTNLIPIFVFSDIFDKNEKQFDIVYSLQKLIQQHLYNFADIQKIFNFQEPKVVLISFLKLLDWCSDVICWENRMINYIEKIFQEYSISSISLTSLTANSNFIMEEYLNNYLLNLFSLFEKELHEKYKLFVYNIEEEQQYDQFIENKKQSVLYEVQSQGIQFYQETTPEIVAWIFFHLKTEKVSGKIGQLIMDSPEVRRFNFQFHENIFSDMCLLWTSKELNSAFTQLLICLITIMMQRQIETCKNEEEYSQKIEL